MIYVVTRDLGLPHTGMATFTSGLVDAGRGLVATIDMADLDTVPAGRHLILFEEHPGNDGTLWLARRDPLRDPPAVGVLVHSPLLQIDLSGDIFALLALLHDRGDGRPLDLIACADRSLTTVLASPASCPVVWLPHCLPSDRRQRAEERRRRRHPDTDMCWMPLTLPDDSPYGRHKNTYCQVAAVRSAADQLQRRLQLSVSHASGQMHRLAQDLAVPMVVAGSMPEPEFDVHLERVSVALCVSLSESFSYNAAELMLSGVPTLFGPAVEWAWQDPEMVELGGVEHPGSVEQIAAALTRLLADPAAAAQLSQRSQQVTAQRLDAHHHQATATIQDLTRQTS